MINFAVAKSGSQIWWFVSELMIDGICSACCICICIHGRCGLLHNVKDWLYLHYRDVPEIVKPKIYVCGFLQFHQNTARFTELDNRTGQDGQFAIWCTVRNLVHNVLTWINKTFCNWQFILEWLYLIGFIFCWYRSGVQLSSHCFWTSPLFFLLIW